MKMSSAVANQIRADKVRGLVLPKWERREAERAVVQAEATRWTFDKLWAEWQKMNAHKSGAANDNNRYQAHPQPLFGGKEPKEVLPLEVDRMRVEMSKGKAAARGVDSVPYLGYIIRE